MQVQGLFGELADRQNRYRNYDPTATVTPQEIRETFNFAQSVWASSIGEADRVVPFIKNVGDLNAMQSLVLRTEIACWLVSLSGHLVAIPAIAMIREDWAKHLEPGDEFLGMLDALAHCAEANRLMELLSKAQPSSERESLLTDAGRSQDQLKADVRSLSLAKRAENFRILCLQKLILLNGPHALNNPPAAAEYSAEYDEAVTRHSIPGINPIRLEPAP
jgi:hypothetical protein